MNGMDIGIPSETHPLEQQVAVDGTNLANQLIGGLSQYFSRFHRSQVVGLGISEPSTSYQFQFPSNGTSRTQPHTHTHTLCCRQNFMELDPPPRAQGYSPWRRTLPETSIRPLKMDWLEDRLSFWKMLSFRGELFGLGSQSYHRCPINQEWLFGFSTVDVYF